MPHLGFRVLGLSMPVHHVNTYFSDEGEKGRSRKQLTYPILLSEMLSGINQTLRILPWQMRPWYHVRMSVDNLSLPRTVSSWLARIRW